MAGEPRTEAGKRLLEAILDSQDGYIQVNPGDAILAIEAEAALWAAPPDRDAVLRILNDSGAYESMEAVADAVLALRAAPEPRWHGTMGKTPDGTSRLTITEAAATPSPGLEVPSIDDLEAALRVTYPEADADNVSGWPRFDARRLHDALAARLTSTEGEPE